MIIHLICNPISDLMFNLISNIVSNPISNIIVSLISNLISNIISNPIPKIITNQISGLISNIIINLISHLISIINLISNLIPITGVFAFVLCCSEGDVCPDLAPPRPPPHNLLITQMVFLSDKSVNLHCAPTSRKNAGILECGSKAVLVQQCWSHG